MTNPLAKQQEKRRAMLIENHPAVGRTARRAASIDTPTPLALPARAPARAHPPGGASREVCLPLAVRPPFISGPETEK